MPEGQWDAAASLLDKGDNGSNRLVSVFSPLFEKDEGFKKNKSKVLQKQKNAYHDQS